MWANLALVMKECDKGAGRFSSDVPVGGDRGAGDATRGADRRGDRVPARIRTRRRLLHLQGVGG